MAESSAPGSASTPPRRRAWLSRSLATLFDRNLRIHRRRGLSGPPPPPQFDVLIVGSGYGGAVAAASLAGCRLPAPNGRRGRRLRIAVLERGREYLPGSFPSQLSELPGHVRFLLPGATSAGGVGTGLFDVRLNADVVSVVANGVGGGSLINAGVMLKPRAAVLGEARWPSQICRQPSVLDPFYDRAAEWLGASSAGTPNTVVDRSAKHDLMQEIAKKSSMGRLPVAVPLTVAFQPGQSTGGVQMKQCVACGDCAIGCNHGAKTSLDVTLLVLARRAGAQIYTGATVLRLEKTGRRWTVIVTHTDAALRQRQPDPLRIDAHRVILAAGTFGSTEILMRSQGSALPLSTLLGQRFSGNGDLFAAVYDMQRNVNAVATEAIPPSQRRIGPTITGTIDHRYGDPKTDLSIQELAVPGPLRRVFEEIFTTTRTLYTLNERDNGVHAASTPDRNAVDEDAFNRTLPLALISRDGADGELVLRRSFDPNAPAADCDGAIHVQWPLAASDPRFDRHHAYVQTLLASNGFEGTLLPNPVWKVQPDEAARQLGLKRGPLLTVHPLGGCPMGDDVRSGVVDHLGQVFSAADPTRPRDVYEGLVVLDGSIVPASLGINPALTITALALRAIEALHGRWRLVGDPGLTHFPSRRARAVQRPIYRQPQHAPVPARTKVQLVERLGGWVTLADRKKHYVQFTLHSERVALRDLMSPVANHRFITYDPRASQLLVFNKQPSPLDEEPRGEPHPLANASAPGPARVIARATIQDASLSFLRLEPSRPWSREWRALLAWFQHRGQRDFVQTFAARIAGLTPPADPLHPGPSGWWSELWDALVGAWAVATRAGAKRTIGYSIKIRDFKVGDGASPVALFGRAAADPRAVFEVCGRKTLTYDGRTSPWQQLMDLTLERFPGMVRWKPRTLSLDLQYLARQGVPLLRVVEQHDHVHALGDLASFHLYLLRTLLDGHAWTFRRPDRVPDRAVHRLPGAARYPLNAPDATELQVAALPGQPGQSVHVRLTRYRPLHPFPGLPPVVLIHGYSASGTTFVHPTLRPGLAGRLVEEGRDVWVLDLRSSCGMPFADRPWTFEEIGCEDIPLAIDHVVKTCGDGEVDVVAHCMGAAMLCMALLRDFPRKPAEGDRYLALRRALRNRIRKIVLSQVGPLVMMSPTNQARGFVMQYLKQLLPTADYRFRPDGDGSMADMLLDRLLATLPYPRDEFRRENPLWPLGASAPWVRTRRRVDAIYSQVFQLGNVSDETLEYLDDFFGPLNMQTVSQAIHFARLRAITDAQGNHIFATPDRLRRLRRYRIMSIHGEENRLADVSTLQMLKDALAPDRYEAVPIPGFGHQDCLIGKDPRLVFDTIVSFLGKP